jgi:hypothetical protein
MKACVVPVVLCIFVLSGGCRGKDLTRSKAAEIIKKTNFSPEKIKERTLGEFTVGADTNAFIMEYNLKQLRTLEKVGWITIAVRRCNGIGGCAVDIAITPKGAEAATSWRKLSGFKGDTWLVLTKQPEFIEVTGVSNTSPTSGQVEYTWRYVPTESGKTLGIAATEPMRETLMMQLFDDGWRIVE